MAAPTTPTAPPAALYRPAGPLDLATALEPYAGPWNVRLAAHLYRRAGFGGSPDDVARTASAGLHAAVDGFIHFADASALPAQPQLVDDRPNRDQLKLLVASAQQSSAAGGPSDDAIVA